MNNKTKFTYIFIIFASMLIPLTGALSGVDTPNFNRGSTTSFPKLIQHQQLNVEFTQQFDTFYSENFPFRSALVSAYHRLLIDFFQETGNEKVLLGQNRMLYFHETLDDFQKTNGLSELDIGRLNETLRIINHYNQQFGTSSYFMVAPNKATIYPENFPKQYTVLGSSSNLEKLEGQNLSISMIDVKNELIRSKNTLDFPIYHHEDSHWNNLGALVATNRLLTQLNKPELSMDLTRISVEKNWHGDLALMLYPSIKRLESQYNVNHLETFTFTRAIRQFDDLQIESLNPNHESSIMMFRDSFANALIPYISNSFAQAFYYRNFPYDFKYIEQHRPDYLVMEIAERNIPWLLQATPVLLNPTSPLSIRATTSMSLPYSLTTSTQNNMMYINARFDDQLEASKVTAIKLAYNQQEIDAFPIYQDGDFQDRILHYGFSAYLDPSINVELLVVYVSIDHQWFILE